MNIHALSNDDLRSIAANLKPLSVLRFMMTCKRIMNVIKIDPIWSSLRSEAKLSPPNPNARKYKLDFYIVLKQACKLCLRNQRCRYLRNGFCDQCNLSIPGLSSLTWRVRCNSECLTRNQTKQNKFLSALKQLQKDAERVREDSKSKEMSIASAIRNDIDHDHE